MALHASSLKVEFLYVHRIFVQVSDIVSVDLNARGSTRSFEYVSFGVALPLLPRASDDLVSHDEALWSPILYPFRLVLSV